MRYPKIAVVLFISLLPLPAHAAGAVHHKLSVSLLPAERRLAATDTITVPDGLRSVQFVLHAGLDPVSTDPKVRVAKESTQQGAVPLETFVVTLPEGAGTFTLRYGGTIYHPVEPAGKEQARGFDQTAGLISEDMVFLSGASAWVPDFGKDLVTFTLEVKLPAGWDAVSQGARTRHQITADATSVRWDSPEPQNEIYLIASRFTEYVRKSGKLTAMVFLRSPDKTLADKYLDATLRSIALYDRLIGPYPYKKFALVENFWETGFGMPSFTLLGPTVVRLPFIIKTSYPHEILHNWWGNSVYPDYEKGNWSEGLTAYLADYLMKEQQGAGAEERMTTLQKYADYVRGGKDFPLTEFRSRHSPATEAIGYGKALLFFHMLRRELGDDLFKQAVREFYKQYKFRYASFDDIKKSFEIVSGKGLKRDFEQWVSRAGAPELKLGKVGVTPGENGFLVTALLEQTQPGEAYHLRVPVAVTMEGRERAYQTYVDMKSKRLDVSVTVPFRPARLDIDPEFDLFRKLDRDETPPAISQALGAKKMLVLLPASAKPGLLNAYRAFAKTFAKSGPDEVEVKLDREVAALPADRAVTVIGWENHFAIDVLEALFGYDVSVKDQAVRIDQATVPRKGHSFVLTARLQKNRDMALSLVATDRPEALPGLARKLPHYHKYSYLAFEGVEPANVAKGRWPVIDSPMTAFLPAAGGRIKKVGMAGLAEREPLAAPVPVFSKERMMKTISFLASDELKGRELGAPGVDRAAEYIAGQFRQAGLLPGGDGGSYFQAWEEPRRKIRMKNVIAVIPGKKKDWQGQSVVVGAHYDHLGLGMNLGRTGEKGRIHPGADDNASGTAVLLELAKTLKEKPAPDRSIVFIAFTGEEEGKLGSRYYVKNEKRYPASKCIGMVNLDTIGRLGTKKLFVLGAGSAKEWAHIFRGAGFATGVDIETVSEELDSSDQKSFEEAGAPAVQLFSGPHLDYHRPTDTVDKIDPDGLVKVAAVAKEAIEYLAGRERPLTSTLKSAGAAQTAPKTERKVGLGTVPDFAYSGTGVRLSGVAPGSPAEASGLKEGDIIIGINSKAVGNLKDFSDVLKTLNPGDKVSIKFLRDGKEMNVETVVKER